MAIIVSNDVENHKTRRHWFPCLTNSELFLCEERMAQGDWVLGSDH